MYNHRLGVVLWFKTLAKVIDLCTDSQYVCHHMAKQTVNANINSSSRTDMNVYYAYEWTIEVWSRRFSLSG